MENISFEVYEVFAQSDPLERHVHVFNVLASSPEMALALAEENFFRRDEFVNLWVVRRDHIHQLGFRERDGYKKLDKPYRTTDDYKYLVEKWRYYRAHPMDREGGHEEAAESDDAVVEQHPGLDAIRSDIRQHRRDLHFHEVRRHGPDALNAFGVLRGERRDRGGGIAAERRDRLDIRLDARAAARIGTGDDEDAALH